MKNINKILIILFAVGTLGLIITAFQNCGGQQPGNSLCFGANCNQITSGSTGTNNNGNPTTPANITSASTNTQKLILASDSCVATSNPLYCAINVSLIYSNIAGRALFVTGGPTGGAQGSASLATCTGTPSNINYTADYISAGYTYTFWLIESNTCPYDSSKSAAENAAIAAAFFNANQATATAKLTVQRSY